MFWKRKRKEFGVKIKTMSQIIYYDRDKQVSLFSEFLYGEDNTEDLAIHVSDAKCWDHPAELEITEEELTLLKKRVSEGLKAWVLWI